MFSAPYLSEPNQCSLAYILDKDVPASRWVGNRPSDTYRNIIRFILRDLSKHENDLGYLDTNYIFVTSGGAKVAQPCNDKRQRLVLRMEFISLIRHMLGDGNNRERLELKHFISMAKRVTFENLFHHPLLQSPSERLFFPIKVTLAMNAKEGGSERRSKRRSESTAWKQDYYKKFAERAVDFKSAIERAEDKVGLESVYKANGYENTVVDVLDFSTNVANHINEHLDMLGEQRMKEDKIENELTRMFPTRLIDLYEFLAVKQISMAFPSIH